MLRDHLLDRVDQDGALRDPCRSRVLESALLLALLDRTQFEPSARSRLAAYLSGHHDSPTPLDRVLARTVLRSRSPVDDLFDVDEFLAEAPDFTGARKQALLQAILLPLGAPVTDNIPDPDAFSLEGLHIWARVQVTAVKIILAHAYGRTSSIQGSDLALLHSTQRTGTVWEGNFLIHLSVLHALAPLPGEQRLVADGIRTALEHQRADGGIPFIRDEDTWVTATAGLALHVAGAPQPVLDAVAHHLLTLQRPGGGWSYTETARLEDADCTSVAVEFLHLTGPDTHLGPIRRGIAALLALRNQDGGFPTYLAGAPSEASMTAAVANALSTQGAALHAEVSSALAFIATQQRRDGSFPPDWSSSRMHTVFRAILAAARLPEAGALDTAAQRITQHATRLVCNSQNADGGWGQQDGHPSDALSTAYALIALANTDCAPGPMSRGAARLLTWQRTDGSIAGTPDSIGPRPFTFSVPILVDIFTLLALGHLTQRITHSRWPAQSSGRTCTP
jgi:squalene-hopene/tetraprenyl-beta-curcumene cyclase